MQTEELTGTNESGISNGAYTIKDLEKFYTQSDEADKELFAEQRSNILLITGEHYNRLRSNFFS